MFPRTTRLRKRKKWSFKMITYKFITQNKSQDMEAMSLKKAMISFNTKAGDAKEVLVEWKSRKGNVSFYKYKLPYKTRKERKGKL
jgi:hypothetical protein